MNPLDKILAFLTQIGLDHKLEPINEKTHLPGLIIRSGSLIIDLEKLQYPGDILHEAGHMACTPPEVREAMTDTEEVNKCHDLGNEIITVAWSYAAALHAGIDPQVVFHEHGYKGQGQYLIQHFAGGGTQGLPMLQWLGMTYDAYNAQRLGEKPFPHMINWLCRINPYVNEEVAAQL